MTHASSLDAESKPLIRLKNLPLPELRAQLLALGEPAFRAEQVIKWVYQKRVDEVRAWQREVEGLIGNGDWDKSESRLEDIKRWEATLPGEMFPETKALIERQEKG